MTKFLVSVLFSTVLICHVTAKQKVLKTVTCTARDYLGGGLCPKDSSKFLSCLDACDGHEIRSKEECRRTPECCFVRNRCVSKLKSAKFDAKIDEEEKTTLKKFMKTQNVTANSTQQQESKSSARNFQFGGFPGVLPGTPFNGLGGINPPSPQCLGFPFDCLPVTNLEKILTPPVDIPYCQREYCSQADLSLEDNIEKCLMRPGCYFDRELHNLRRAFGHRVLPTVPVCHLAIRNHVFQKKSVDYVGTNGGKWNPAQTECFLKKHYDDIYTSPRGCDMNDVIEYFGYRPKMAGWTGIVEKECYLINGCWKNGQGCFYPMEMTKLFVKSGQSAERKYVPATQTYGMPKCQPFDSSTPETFLKSYHTCLASGCSLDSTVTNQMYYYNLWNITRSLPAQLQYISWLDIANANIRADNFEEQIQKYQQMSVQDRGLSMMSSLNAGSNLQLGNFLSTLTSTPKNNIGNQNNYMNPSFNLNQYQYPMGPSTNPLLGILGGNMLSGMPDSPAVKSVGAENCPYQEVRLYNFPQLKGSFTGCCERNLCYLPKKSLNLQRSGIANYYSTWTQWSTCTKSCGNGDTKRTRRCISREGARCGGVEDETKRCNTKPCPVWSKWGSYQPCAVSCGGGKTVRRRLCSGDGCEGKSEQAAVCNSGKCPVFSSWTAWSKCSVTCGEGTKIRYRLCLEKGDYGCPESEPTEEVGCRSYCGKISWSGWSECDYNACTKTKTPSCNFNGGRGFCQNFPRPITAKCDRMKCYCKKNPGYFLC